MANLIGTYVANNYNQVETPFSRFGTRKLAWYKIGHFDDNLGSYGSPEYDMSTINKVIKALETQVELYFVGVPTISNNWAKFMVAVAENTANDGEHTDGGANPNAKTLQQILEALNLGGDGVIVERRYVYGDEFTTNNDYAELG